MEQVGTGRGEAGRGVAGGPATAAATDLRRKRRRELVERIVERAELLPPGDRALVHAHYRDGRSVAEIARAGGGSARPLRRRLKRLVERELDPLFAFVSRRRESWSSTRRRVATSVVIEGWSMRETSRRLGLSLHTVRRHHDAVRAMFEAEADRA